MYNSIKYFEEECISKFEKLEDDFIKEPQKLAEYILNPLMSCITLASE